MLICPYVGLRPHARRPWVPCPCLFDTCWSLTRADATALGLFDTCWSSTRSDATAFALFDTCWSLTRPDAKAFGLFDTCWSLTRPDVTAFGRFLTILSISRSFPVHFRSTSGPLPVHYIAYLLIPVCYWWPLAIFDQISSFLSIFRSLPVHFRSTSGPFPVHFSLVRRRKGVVNFHNLDFFVIFPLSPLIWPFLTVFSLFFSN